MGETLSPMQETSGAEWSIASGRFDPSNVDLEAAQVEVERLEWSAGIQHSNEMIAMRIRAADILILATNICNPSLKDNPEAVKMVQSKIIAEAKKFSEQIDFNSKAISYEEVGRELPVVQAIDFLAANLEPDILPETTRQLGLELAGYIYNKPV